MKKKVPASHRGAARKRKGVKKSRGAHALRVELIKLRWHLTASWEAMEDAEKRAKEAGATDQLAVAVKALRSIANHAHADARAKGIAAGALKRMKVTQ